MFINSESCEITSDVSRVFDRVFEKKYPKLYPESEDWKREARSTIPKVLLETFYRAKGNLVYDASTQTFHWLIEDGWRVKQDGATSTVHLKPQSRFDCYNYNRMDVENALHAFQKLANSCGGLQNATQTQLVSCKGFVSGVNVFSYARIELLAQTFRGSVCIGDARAISRNVVAVRDSTYDVVDAVLPFNPFGWLAKKVDPVRIWGEGLNCSTLDQLQRISVGLDVTKGVIEQLSRVLDCDLGVPTPEDLRPEAFSGLRHVL